MCGITGVLSFESTPDLGLITQMLSRLPHRGPDGSGIYRDPHVALGHARLAIIDVAGGAQPMSNRDGSVWVTFNGEIFNYVELRQELTALGHQFTTASDTEVIVHAWEQWQEGCFERFNGQWALAIWERDRERLVLSRDRCGVRPLYFTRHGGRLLFASEVKALFADPQVPREFDRVGLAEAMTFWSTVAPRTVFAGIQQLPPGHVSIIDRGGQRTFPYWQLQFPPRGEEEPQDFEQNVRDLRERVIEAVRVRFERSDVPVGAYLSGGLDSAITAAVIARYTDAPLQTFSLRFADSDYDEGSFQSVMAQRLGTEHHHLTVHAHDIGEAFPTVVRHTEAPILRAAPAPMLLLSGLARERGFKVVVTGEGADEVFAGYDIFREARLRQFIARNPDSEVRARGLELLYPWLGRSPGQSPAFAREFFSQRLDPADPAFSHRTRWDTTSKLLGMTMPHPDQDSDVAATLLERMPPEHSQWDPLSRAQWLEMVTLLPGYILSSQGDRMLMANSVEGRFPFLDRDVVDLANRLPARHKLLGLNEKHILKEAFKDLLPDEILNRPKQPYRAPDAASFFDGSSATWVDEMVDSDLVSAAGVFEPRYVAALVAKCRRTGGVRMSNTDNMRITAVLSTQLIYHQFIEGDGSSEQDRPPAPPMTVVDLVTAS
ncbi:asparagine synthase (glutamine-hydrolyzing) [Ornithinimicrobium ciconiae]|uniref:asparagine synthase (glutamine-hydrolyzing) n=1 Tax=Ornithinimicrobium ciconiae TaxID=2594265 RepID=A0A516G7E0_9MICO|nr:asparagine synthase (glutamine-hydrolyzing) [Ornithinimicrobium ciconiae]QDO87438.1 asparagine synthase (glutamine-hydrolyzing) [Ornithinimicrobium ciconiae]